MNRQKALPIAFIIILFAVSACSKDRLKPDPLSFFTPENVFIDEAGFEAGLVTCRKEMNAENHGDLCYIPNETTFSDLAIPLRQSDWTKITPSSVIREPVLTFFNNAYGYIKNANTVITRIDDIAWTNQNSRNRILSEALWFRAYWYFRLVNDYGDVPWVGEELKGPKLDYQSTTREAIITQLLKDLEYALAWLPVTPAKVGDISKGAANHLLCKIYLANADLDKAIAAADAVISGPYALMQNRFGIDAANRYHNVMWDLHRWQNKNIAQNTETIYATVDRPDAPPGTWFNPVGTYSMRNYAPSYWKVLDATGNRATNWDTRSGDTLGIGNGDVRTNHFFNYWLWEDRQYKWNNTSDMRRDNSNWIEMGDSTAEIITVRAASPNLGQPLTKRYFKTLVDTTDTWYPWPYYKVFVPTPNFAQPMGGQADWYIFRLAETYLLRAEAYYYKGQLAAAATDINRVRQRAGALPVTSGEVTLDYIFDERARELYAEEPRHAEMVRASFILAKLGRDGYTLSSISTRNWYYDRVKKYNPFFTAPLYSFFGNTAQISPFNMLWPVPQSVISANTLGRINQNIGYAGAELNQAALTTIP
jgi:hypothetical protein